ncbi:MAG: electron transport complex subunit RsxC [Clostridia bacterium]|nr:electron transport complex subunit RsxC [Clostridia bacterium]
MSFFLSGVHLPHRKRTEKCEPAEMPPPKTVILPMTMHIGTPARPTVKKGERVCVGTLVGEAQGEVSANIHASVSGTVAKIEDITLASGAKCPAVFIDSDGLMEKEPSLSAPEVKTSEEFLAAVKKSGIVGLGGAGFPTHVKLASGARTLIINAAECEPYITSDTYTLTHRGADIESAVSLFQKFLGVEKVIIGIEKNKPDAIAKMREIATKNEDVELKILPEVYPQGAEKVLVYHATGKVVPAGKLPQDVGALVLNCTTAASVAEYMRTGMPLVKKCVTVDGDAVKSPQNVLLPIGTPLSDVFDFCGGFSHGVHKVLYGGPMMGVAVPSLSLPVLKNTNALLAFGKESAVRPRSTQCIRCGLCMAHCPVRLAPFNIAKAYKNGNAEMLFRLRADICMDCGCCTYVCPAKRPLAETNKMAKILLREYMKTRKEGAK